MSQYVRNVCTKSSRSRQESKEFKRGECIAVPGRINARSAFLRFAGNQPGQGLFFMAGYQFLSAGRPLTACLPVRLIQGESMTTTDPVHNESETHTWSVNVPDHPQRADSPEYTAAKNKMNEIAAQAAGLHLRSRPVPGPPRQRPVAPRQPGLAHGPQPRRDLNGPRSSAPTRPKSTCYARTPNGCTTWLRCRSSKNSTPTACLTLRLQTPTGRSGPIDIQRRGPLAPKLPHRRHADG